MRGQIELTNEEKFEYMPRWKKALLFMFCLALPIIGSIDKIQF